MAALACATAEAPCRAGHPRFYSAPKVRAVQRAGLVMAMASLVHAHISIRYLDRQQSVGMLLFAASSYTPLILAYACACKCALCYCSDDNIPARGRSCSHLHAATSITRSLAQYELFQNRELVQVVGSLSRHPKPHAPNLFIILLFKEKNESK